MPKSPESRCPFASLATKTAAQSRSDPTLAIPERYRHASLTAHEKELVRATAPILKVHGVDITKLFYDNMLEAKPELHDIFNKANQKHLEQPKALANAVIAYAENIDDLTPLGPIVELVANKHASLYVQPQQYYIVGKHLINAIGTVLGDAVTPELAAAWTKAYWILAEIFINREEQLYQASHGWTAWSDFRIAKKVKESDEITSFYLEPIDESLKPLPKFIPGQYISVQIDVPALGHRQARQYSLSEQPDPNYYRVSIKAERGYNSANGESLPGLISILMHDSKYEGDIVRVSHPQGDFFLNSQPEFDSPLVMISGGVGLTPLTSMLNLLTTRNSTAPISWVHGARHSSVRPFKNHVKQVAATHPNVKFTWFNDHPSAEEVEGEDFHFRGYIDLNILEKENSLFLDNAKTQYYICGPLPFMLRTEKELGKHGVSANRIHMEKFGTGGTAGS